MIEPKEAYRHLPLDRPGVKIYSDEYLLKKFLQAILILLSVNTALFEPQNRINTKFLIFLRNHFKMNKLLSKKITKKRKLILPFWHLVTKLNILGLKVSNYTLVKIITIER